METVITSEPALQTTEQDTIDYVIGELIDEKCILFLGPELLINDSGEKHYKVYFKELAKRYAPFIYKYFSRDNVFLFQKSYDNDASIIIRKTKIRNEIKSFYDTKGDETILNIISQLPFPLIINVAPDNAINKMFDKNHFSYQQGHFPSPSISNMEKPTAKKPFIYNIFGSIAEKQSIILTHEELFKKIKDLSQENAIPKAIVDSVNEATSFIFLGMKFEAWYYQFLLSIFNIEISKSLKLGTPRDSDEETVSIVDEYFRIEFTKTNSLDFINKIYKKFGQDHPAYLRNITISNSTSSYMSYAWNDDTDANREYWVDKIDTGLNNAGVKISRDRNVLSIQDSIQAFMNRIGRGRTVTIIVSEKYLYSEYCMYEAWSIFKNDNFSDRAFIMILPDVDLLHKEKYIEHWQKKTNAIRNKIETEFNNDYLAFDEFMGKSKGSFYILLFINQFLNILTDRIWPRMLVEDDNANTAANKAAFDNFMEKILTKLNEE